MRTTQRPPQRPNPSFSLGNRGVVAPIVAGIAEQGVVTDIVSATGILTRTQVRIKQPLGQSNAEGRGTAAQAPDASGAGYYFNPATGTVTPLVEPVGGAQTGSMWSADALAYYNATGIKTVYVENALTGAPLLPDVAGANWSPSGSLRAEAQADLLACIEAVDARFERVGVEVVILQGENDAINGVAEATYEAAYDEWIDSYVAAVPEIDHVYCIPITGYGTGGGLVRGMDATSLAFQAIRRAQFSVGNSNPNASIAYPGMYAGLSRGYQIDAVHTGQTGLNIAGEAQALQRFDPQAALPVSAILGSQTFTDTTTTGKMSRAATPTVPPGTKCIAIAIATQRLTQAAGYTISATLGKAGGDVTMNAAAYAQSSSSSPACRTHAGIRYLNESDYGLPFSGLTTEQITVTGTSSQNMIDFCVFYLAEEMVPDSEGGQFPAGTASATGAASLQTFAPAIVITAGSAAAASASPLTATFTGATETMDHSLSTGTRAGVGLAGYSVEAVPVSKTVSILLSGTPDHFAVCSVALRRKVAGE